MPEGREEAIEAMARAMQFTLDDDDEAADFEDAWNNSTEEEREECIAIMAPVFDALAPFVVLGSELEQVICPECYGSGTAIRGGTPWPILEALGAPNDSTIVPCHVCLGAKVVYRIREARDGE